MKLLLAIFLFCAVAQAQNCTTTPVMNTVNIATGNSVVGNNTTHTITVTLAAAWTQGSGTGYATIYNNGAPNANLVGSYKIMSGNGTGTNGSIGATQIVLDQTTRTNNGGPGTAATTGQYISDLAVVKNNARGYTISWTTPGFASTSNMSYSDDADTQGGGGGAFGYNWVHQDTTTGVVMHSITLSNLDLFLTENIGKYAFTVWSECFTNGMPDQTKFAPLPFTVSPVGLARMANYDHQILVNGTAPLCTAAATCAAGIPDNTPNLDTFTLSGYDGQAAAYVVIPQQDGIHPGFRVAPGGVAPLNLPAWDNSIPGTAQSILGDNGVHVTVDDWYGTGTGLLSLGASGSLGGGGSTGAWTSTTQVILSRMGSGGSNLGLNIPSNAPTTGTACTNLHGDSIMLDGVTPACAYPLRLTATKWISAANYICGTKITCGPPGTVAQTPPVSLPYTAEVWIIVFSPPAIPQSTVGAWVNQYTNMPGVPCELQANINVDKPNPAIAAAGCRNQTSGQGGGLSGGLFAYNSNQDTNCTFNGSGNENSYTVTSTPVWFYDNPYVCHTLDVMYPKTNGQNNDSFEKHILGIYWQQSGYPRSVEAQMVDAFAVSGPATATNNPICNVPPISNFNRNPFCATLTIPVTVPTGDTTLSTMATNLANGERYRACINIDNPHSASYTGGYSYGCYVFPYNLAAPTPTAAAGGTIAASTNVQIVAVLTASTTLNVYNVPAAAKNVVVDSTCPTSGNCSINVPSYPAGIVNAQGYDVYARVNGSSCVSTTTPPWAGCYMRQNTAGPIPIGTAFQFGTATQPFVTSGGYLAPWGGFGATISNVLAVDAVNNTVTIDTQQGWAANPSNTNNSTIFFMRQFTGIPADATSTSNTIVCASCYFSTFVFSSDFGAGIPAWGTVYCGVTAGDLGPFPNYALYTQAPSPGSTIQSIDIVNHTITLTNPINCGPGINFEIRQVASPAGANRIFVWSKGSYDVWKRFGNYVGADMVNWNTQNASPPNNAGITSPGGGVSYIWTRRRESSLTLMNCQTAIHLATDLMTLGTTTAISPAALCASASAAALRPQGLFSMIDSMTNSNMGRGASAGSFLDGLVLNALINWYIDPAMNASADNSYLYWSKRLIDMLWNSYYNARGSVSTLCPPYYPHEYSYDMESQLRAICGSNGIYWYPNGYGVGAAAPVADYWSIYGNIYPAFAFFYNWTGNATIPNSNPPTTYGQAYQDMASWGFVHMSDLSGYVNPNAGLKTLGEMGIWQDQAINWMKGNGGTSPSTLSIITSTLPAGTVGMTYNATMAATGGVPPYTWTSTGLPSGLTMTTGGVISGTPTVGGSSPVTFTVNDSMAGTASSNISITVAGPTPTSVPDYQTGLIP